MVQARVWPFSGLASHFSDRFGPFWTALHTFRAACRDCSAETDAFQADRRTVSLDRRAFRAERRAIRAECRTFRAERPMI